MHAQSCKAQALTSLYFLLCYKKVGPVRRITIYLVVAVLVKYVVELHSWISVKVKQAESKEL